MKRLFFVIVLIILIGNIKAQSSFCYSISAILTFPTDLGPGSFVTNDFNADGNKDIVVVNGGANNLTYLSGLGTGSFVSSGTLAINATGPVSVKAADINNDSNMDLVVANKTSKNLSFLLGTGVGTFSLPIIFTHSLNTDPTSICVVDVTKDGNVDIGVANLNTGLIGNPSRLAVFLGNGLSAFTYTYSTLGIAPPSGMIHSDFDNDTNIDYAISGGAGHFNIIPGNSTGSFGVGPQNNIFNGPYSLTSGDFNSDGKVDVAIGGANGNCASVFIANGSGFLPYVDYAVGSNPRSITSGDLNNDGVIDLVLTNTTMNTISFLFGNGDGTFNSQITYPVGVNPVFVELDDVNNDGIKDVIVSNNGNNTLSVLLGICVTGINENLNKTLINFYPNPVIELISVTVIKKCLFQISDVNGKLLIKKEIEKGVNEIDVSTLSHGIYFISTNENGYFSHNKFIKE